MKDKKRKEKENGFLKKYLYQIIIILFVFVLYGNTINNKYSLDDDLVVENHPLVEKGIKGIPEIFTTHYKVDNKMSFGYRPVVIASFALEYEIFGKKPTISHLFNIIYYILTGLLLFVILRTFFRNYSVFFSFLITMLFLAHPLHTEVVASLKNRDEILSLLFALLAMRSFFKFTDGKNKYLHLLLGPIFFAISLFSKLSSLPFLALFPLAIYYFRKVSFKQIFYVFLAAFIVVLIVRFLPKNFLQETIRESDFFENPLFAHKTFENRLLALLVSFFYYIKLIIVPYPMRYYYGYNTIDITNWGHTGIYISIILIAIFIYLIIKNFKKKSPVIFALMFFLISVSMFLNFVKPNAGIIADRFLYAASLGFSIIVVIFIYNVTKINYRNLEMAKNEKRKVLIPIIILLFIYSCLAIPRNKNWYDRISLFSHDIQFLENSAKANDMYASALSTKVSIELARNPKMTKEQFETLQLCVTHFKKAIDVYPEYKSSMNKLGSVYALYLHDYNNAIKYFDMALNVDSGFKESYLNLSYCYKRLGEYEKSAGIIRKFLKFEPDNVRALSELANAHFNMGDTIMAIKMNLDIINEKPNEFLPFINLGKYYILLKDTLQAIKYFESAYQINNYNPEACYNLYFFYTALKQNQKALVYYNKLKSNQIAFEKQTIYD
ncbi:MAG: hypothetical protein ABIJ97_08665 [Bacteroidota bacterium]